MANAAIVGPMIIATATNAAAFVTSPVIPKTSIPQLAIPNASTAKIIAMIRPMMLMARSFAEETAFSAIASPQDVFSWLAFKTFVRAGQSEAFRLFDSPSSGDFHHYEDHEGHDYEGYQRCQELSYAK